VTIHGRREDAQRLRQELPQGLPRYRGVLAQQVCEPLQTLATHRTDLCGVQNRQGLLRFRSHTLGSHGLGQCQLGFSAAEISKEAFTKRFWKRDDAS
jgi:hypothetical protein